MKKVAENVILIMSGGRGAEIWHRRSETIRMMGDGSQALIKDRSVS